MPTICVFPLCTVYPVHLLGTFSLSAEGKIEPRACTCLVSALLLSGSQSPHKVLMKVLSIFRCLCDVSDIVLELESPGLLC